MGILLFCGYVVSKNITFNNAKEVANKYNFNEYTIKDWYRKYDIKFNCDKESKFKEDYFEKKDEENKRTIEWIVPNAQKDAMEPVRLTLASGGRSEVYLPHEGEDFGYVLKGSVKVHYGGRSHTVRAGESFYFKAGQKHFIENTGTREAVLIWVTTPPSL